jgi:hypothetical protein
MAEEKFFSVSGKFICQKCKEDIISARFWYESKDITWMCSIKHISRVELLPKKKKKKDFEDE